jgi:hypothetical protein
MPDRLTSGKYFFLLYAAVKAPQQVGDPLKRAVAFVTVS